MHPVLVKVLLDLWLSLLCSMVTNNHLSFDSGVERRSAGSTFHTLRVAEGLANVLGVYVLVDVDSKLMPI